MTPAAWQVSRPRWRTLVSLAAGLGLASGAALSMHALGDVSTPEEPGENLYYPSGKFLREATAGFHEVAADYLWFQTVQYYGGFRKGHHDLRYFRGLVDNVVTLDPRFLEAYRFSALVLAMDLGDDWGAINILKRGILVAPDRWVLPFEIGFIYYVFSADYPRASVWFDAAARASDADDFVRRFAAFSHQRAGQLEVSMALWRNLLETTHDPYMKALARSMIAECEAKAARRAAAGGRNAP